MTWRRDLEAALGDAVEFDAPLASRVTFRIGGPADAYVKARSVDALQAALEISRQYNVPVTVLGSGSNVLIGDAGIRGMVLRLAGALRDVEVDTGLDAGSPATVEVGAGVLNSSLVARVLGAGCVGIEFLATIPGTFGGALIMNAGAHGSEIAPFVREVRLLDRDSKLVTRGAEACGFVYRGSAFASGEWLVGATLSVPPGDVSAARAHLKQMREARGRTQPVQIPNAGSIFKNPPGDHAGRLIEACGLKGRSVGGAQVSHLHANFLVNTGGATAKDVVQLADEVVEAVRLRFSVQLEWEVRRLGEF